MNMAFIRAVLQKFYKVFDELFVLNKHTSTQQFRKLAC